VARMIRHKVTVLGHWYTLWVFLYKFYTRLLGLFSFTCSMKCGTTVCHTDILQFHSADDDKLETADKYAHNSPWREGERGGVEERYPWALCLALSKDPIQNTGPEPRLLLEQFTNHRGPNNS
jgi:hypothetical protein